MKYLRLVLVGVVLLLPTNGFSQTFKDVNTLECLNRGYLTTALDSQENTANRGPVKVYERPKGLFALELLNVGLQAYDGYSTLKAIKFGAVEANQHVEWRTRHPIRFITLKAGITAATIAAAELFWRHGHDDAAYGIMAGSNGVMVFVAINNTKVLKGLK